jgi:hypothetical protein
MDYGTGSTGSSSPLFSGDEETAQAASEYSGIAVGDITTVIDQLRTAQLTLQANESTLQHRQAEDLADQARQAADLTQADATQGQLEASQARVTGQLATAVAQQATAQADAAKAAIAAARRVAQQGSGSHSGSGPNSGSGSTSAPVSSAVQSPPATSGPRPVPVASGGGGGATTDPALNPFLQCVVQAESGGNYGAVSPNGLYMGAFQFSQPTWNVAAQDAGFPALVGMRPNLASKADQDTLAVALYALDGEQPWLGDRCS